MSSSNPNVQATARRVRGMPLALPPGWRAVGTHPIGGLISVAFDRDSELLLITSHQGRGVFDCTTGQRVARDQDSSYAWEDAAQLTAQGFGPLTGKTLATAGLYGGGLPFMSG